MPFSSAIELYQQAALLARQGRLQEALDHLDHFLKVRPSYGPAWHLAARLRKEQGEFQKAMDAFRRCCSLPAPPKEVWADLARTCLETGQPRQAAGLLKTLRAEGLWDDQLVLEIARTLEQQRDPAGAMDVLQKGRALSQQPEVFERPIELLREKRAKIAFFCGNDGPTFLKDIMAYLARRYPVRVFEGTNTAEMAELMNWSDISWFEWATHPAHHGSGLPKVCRTIVRLHRYEAYLSWPELIQWPNVDLLITVGNSYVMDALEHWVPDIRRQVAIASIPNGVNLESIRFENRPRGKQIAFVATLRMVKNPMLLLQCMAYLHQIDPEYHLFIAGDQNDLLLVQYLRHQIRALGLEKVVHFDGWQSDIQSWLKDKHYLVVTSVIESQGMGALEAMAAGLKPVIHNFPGAEEIYPKQFLFNTPEEFCRQILSEEYEPRAYREFVEQRYPLSRTLLKIDEIMASFEENDRNCSEKTAEASRFPSETACL